MKTLVGGFTLSLGISTSAMAAEQMLNVDGIDYPLSTLMQNCQGMADTPAAQIACFSSLSKLMEEQAGDAPEETVSVPEALDALRAVAQYQDNDTGLLIAGSDCNIQVTYFNNYFHLSRRNISTIDVFFAQFDASQLQYDQIRPQGAQAPLSQAVMESGATASMRGGMALESSQHNFDAKSPRATLDAYATEVANQLPPRDGQTIDFVLVHPKQSQASTDIWNAFENFVKACKS